MRRLFVVLLLVVALAGSAGYRPSPANAETTVTYHAYLPVILKNYPPPPAPEITTIAVGQPVLGETARLLLAATNTASPVPGFSGAGRGYDNAIVVLLPQDQEGSVLRADDVSVVAADGLTVTTTTDRGFLWLTASRPVWNAGETYTLTLDLSPREAGTYYLPAKVVMHSRPTDGLPYTDPWSGETVTEADVRFVNPPIPPSWVDPDGDETSLLSMTVSAGDFWERINAYRTQAGLPVLEERSDLASGCVAHAQYMLAHDVVTHTENVQDADYSAEGDAAGQASILVGANVDGLLEAEAADSLMLSPFSLVPVLNPWLRWSGSGYWTDGAGTVRQAGCFDVARGIDYTASPSWPVQWPQGIVSTLALPATDAVPDPLEPCGYASPSGAPVVVLTGDDAPVPVVTDSSFDDVTSDVSVALPHCTYTEDTYLSADETAQQTGRSVLAFNHAVVLLPENPLEMGHCYSYAITTDAATYTGAFCTTSWTYTLPPGLTVR